MKLSILIPLFNERPSLHTFWTRLKQAPLSELKEITSVEIIVVNDGSTDGSDDLIIQLSEETFRFGNGIEAAVMVLHHDKNLGKGAAVRTALAQSTGDVVIVQDADLELSPQDYPKMIRPILDGHADAVFGSRFTSQTRRVMLFWHSLTNKILTLFVNVLLDLNLTDFGTGYKAMRGEFSRTLRLKSNRFGIEAELTARLAHAKARIYEVSVSYTGRTYDEGKKITLLDGLSIPLHILRFTLLDREPFIPSMRQTLRALDESSDQIYAPALQKALNFEPSRRGWQNILEIGSGTGNLTKWLVKKGRVTATDIQKEFIEDLKVRFSYFDETQARQWDATKPAWRGAKRYDTVVAFNVLEHIEDDRKALKTWASLVEENGRLIILVPHNQRLFSPIDKAVGHYRRYSRQELCQKIEETGLIVKNSFYSNFLGVFGWWVTGILLKRSDLNSGSVRLYALVKKYFGPIERIFEHFTGLSVVVVATAPIVSVHQEKAA